MNKQPAEKTHYAFCYASGHIDFGTQIPKGCLPIANGPRAKLIEFMDGVARHDYDGKTLLVPGIPEAPNDTAKLDALQRFTAWISEPPHLPEGVETTHSKHRPLATAHKEIAAARATRT